MSLGIIAAHEVVGGASDLSARILLNNPALYWKFDETSGTTAADASPNGRNGTYTNSPTLGATSLRTDAVGAAMGTTANAGTCASIASAAWMNGLTAFTVFSIINFTSAVDGANGDAIASRYAAGGFQWLCWRNTAGKLALQISLSPGGFFNAASATTLTSSTRWVTAARWNGTHMQTFIGGAADGSATAASGSLSSTTHPIEFGRYSLSNATTPGGRIDEGAFFPHAVSDAEIAAISALA